MADLIESCCFNYERDQCRDRPGRRCACGCHVMTDHRLQAYCDPATSCPMVHPCHVPGCTLSPEWHPK